MTAAITDTISKVSSGVRPVSTTVSTLRTSGATTLACADLTGWTTTEVVYFVTYKIDGQGKVIVGSQSDWKGVVSGSSVNNLTLTGGTDAGNAAGDIVEMLPTAQYAKDLAETILASLDQDGTLKAGAVDVAAVLASNVVTTAKILNANVTNAKLATGAGEAGGAWTAWTPTLGAITIGNGTTVAKYTQIGKTIHATLEVTWGSTTSQSGTFTFTIPAAANASYTASRHVLGEVSMWDNSATQLYSLRALLTSSTVVTPRVFHADGVYLYSPSTDIISATQPVTWAVGDVFSAYLTYEAA